MSIFAERLKESRLSKGLSQSDLAIAIKVSPALVNLMEAGKRNPSLDTLLGLSDTLGSSIDYLIGRSSSSNTEVILCGNGHLASAYRRLCRLSRTNLELASSLIATMYDQHFHGSD